MQENMQKTCKWVSWTRHNIIVHLHVFCFRSKSYRLSSSWDLLFNFSGKRGKKIIPYNLVSIYGGLAWFPYSATQPSVFFLAKSPRPRLPSEMGRKWATGRRTRLGLARVKMDVVFPLGRWKLCRECLSRLIAESSHFFPALVAA